MQTAKHMYEAQIVCEGELLTIEAAVAQAHEPGLYQT